MSISGVLVRLGAVAGLAWVAGFVLFTATTPEATPLAVATDAVVVLTGGPGRLARGVAVMEAGSARRMLVSGVDAAVTRAELAAILDKPADGSTLTPAARIANRRLLASVVDLGYGAIDTRSNAAETTAWMARGGFGSLRLVTSGWHMRRAELELRAQLPGDIVIITDAVPIEPAAASVAREYNKLLLRWVVLSLGIAR
ncbi:MAG: YdcF family protein [Polymorphobacter sp.]